MAIAFEGEGEFDDDEFDLFGTPELDEDDEWHGDDGTDDVDLKPCPQCKTSGRDIRDSSQECRVCDGVGWI
jgi:DnaJ-class molecular chaperone